MQLRRKKQASEVRQRPLDRSSQRQVYSYYGQASQVKKQTAEKTIDLGKRKQKLRLIPSLLAVAVIVISILFSLTVAPTPQIDLLKGQSSVYRNPDEYAAAVAKLIESRIGNRTKLTINTADIEQKLVDQFPELKAAVLRLSVLGRKPSLVIDIRVPVILLINARQSVVLDSSGVVVAEARTVSAETLSTLQVIQDQNDIEYKLGQQAVTTEATRFIVAISAQLQAKELKITRLTLPVSANELDIQIEGIPYFVKTDMSGDARMQAGSFLAVKEDLEGKGVVPSEYIDVRVEEKVFYK